METSSKVRLGKQRIYMFIAEHVLWTSVDIGRWLTTIMMLMHLPGEDRDKSI